MPYCRLAITCVDVWRAITFTYAVYVNKFTVQLRVGEGYTKGRLCHLWVQT